MRAFPGANNEHTHAQLTELSGIWGMEESHVWLNQTHACIFRMRASILESFNERTHAQLTQLAGLWGMEEIHV